MRKAPASTAVLLAIACAACVMPGKPVKEPLAPPPAPVAVAKPAPEPPREPLSIPQTQVQLPQPQIIPDEALVMAPPEPAPEPANSANRPPTRGKPAVGATPAPMPVSHPPQQMVTPAAESTLPAIGEVITENESRQLREHASSRRKEVDEAVRQLKARRLNPTQQSVLTLIEGFLLSSSEAEKKNDARLADALAERAQNLARDLVNAK